MKHFINILDHSEEDLRHVLDRALDLKQRRARGIQDRIMAGKVLGMYFEKPSLRTRVSLEAAMGGMGGTAINLETGGKPLDHRETVRDQAGVMSRYVDVVTMRTFSHENIEVFANHATVPVINALSDWSHPTQAMADILTLQEHFGDLAGRTLAFVGDGNNVARSLAALCARIGMRFVLACPDGYEMKADFLAALAEACPGADVRRTGDPHEAVREASAVYTDVWASMGQEEEQTRRREAFLPFQLNGALLAAAPKEAVVLHCLPAHRGEEITDEALDSPRSLVLDEAENRMHINRGLLAVLVAEGKTA